MAAERALIYEFVGEAKEHLANVGDDLVALEQGSDESAVRYRINRLFRAVHSVKGGAGFFGCRAIEQLAQTMETVLERMRQGLLAPGAGVIDALLAGADRVLVLLDDVEQSNEADVSLLVARLQALVQESGVRGQESGVRGQEAETSLTVRPADHGYLYQLTIDLTECRSRQGMGPIAVLQRLQEFGAIIDGRLEVPAANLHDMLPTGPVHYHTLHLDVPTTRPIPAHSWPAARPEPMCSNRRRFTLTRAKPLEPAVSTSASSFLKTSRCNSCPRALTAAALFVSWCNSSTG